MKRYDEARISYKKNNSNIEKKLDEKVQTAPPL
jgi:hypothetical protein